MADTPNWTNIALVIIAAVAAIIALISRNDAKKSAQEATRARKISQADLLLNHFHNVEHLLSLISGNGGSKAEIKEGLQSIKALTAFIQDIEFQNILNLVSGLVTKYEDHSFEAIMSINNDREIKSFQLPENMEDIITTFNYIKHQKLNIE